jgi:hypothetical protein
MLKGADYYWNIMGDHTVRGGPTEVSSKLGYLLSGPLYTTGNYSTHHIMNVIFCRAADVQDLERFWKIESAGIVPDPSEITFNKYLEHYQEKSIGFENGQYVAKLTWKIQHPDFPTIYDVTLRRTQHTIQRLSKNPDILKHYGDIITEQEKRGFIEKVSDTDNMHARVHYTTLSKTIRPRLLYASCTTAAVGSQPNTPTLMIA